MSGPLPRLIDCQGIIRELGVKQHTAERPITDLAAQLGHARNSVTLNVYGHVLLGEGDE